MDRVTGDGTRRAGPPGPWSYVACYGLYAVVAALCYLSFWTWRRTVEVVAGTLSLEDDARQVGYLLLMLGIGLALFVLALAGEAYLRGGLEARRGAARRQPPWRRLVARWLRLVLPLGLTLCLALLLQVWAEGRAAAGSQAAGGDPTGPPAPPPDTQGRGHPLPGVWLISTGLGMALTIVLAALSAWLSRPPDTGD